MKKMQGVVDPISLGFILSGLIFGVGVTTTTNNDIEAGKVAKAKVETSQTVTVKHAVKPAQPSQHSIYDF